MFEGLIILFELILMFILILRFRNNKKNDLGIFSYKNYL